MVGLPLSPPQNDAQPFPRQNMNALDLDLSNNRQTFHWEYHADEKEAVFRLQAGLERLRRRASHCLVL